MAILHNARIEGKADVTGDLFKMWLRPEVPFKFEPGQYMTIGKDGIERPYSIASAPHEKLIELFIEQVVPTHGGKLTPILARLSVGDFVSMRPSAKGRFLFQPNFKNHVMVSTVTGIAPFVSMIRSAVHREKGRHRFFVMEGASHQDEFGYASEFQSLAKTYPNMIHYIASVSRPDAERNMGWSGPTGRVNLLVEDYIARWGLTQSDTLIYLCGNPGMIKDLTRKLQPKNWSLTTERYWKEPDTARPDF